MDSHYVTEYSNSAAPATVTSALAGLLAADQDIVQDTLRDMEYLLNNVDDLEGEDIPTTEDILDIYVKEIDFDEDVTTERFIHLAAE